MNVLGLTDAEAADRLAECGLNEPVATVRRSLARQILARFGNPLVLILVLASAASAAVGDWINAVIVVTMVLLSVTIDFVQTRRSERSAEALRELVAQNAVVLRDGVFRVIARRFVVPGDVVRLEAGAMVPADAKLIEAKDLHVSEAALTGESLPVEKSVGEAVLMGTSVVSGTAKALVTLTGPKTAFGAVAKALAERPPASEFERGIVRFGVFVVKTVVFLVLFVFLANAALHRDPLESLLFGVALAVGLTPEFLPMITTVTLTSGAQKMARAKVVVKQLAAIQNLGSLDVLCSDKTGTLTTGEMTLETWVDVQGTTSERPLLLGYVGSYFESGVDNPLDEATLRQANLNPLDSAVLRHPHPDISGFTKLDEIPFDFERRRVSVLVRRGAEKLLVTKGAPEPLFGICANVEADGDVRPFDEELRRHASETFERLSAEGYRVVAVAHALLAAPSCSKDDEQGLTFSGFLAFADPPREDTREVLAGLAAAGVEVKVLTGDSELVTRHVCERVGLPNDQILLGSDIDRMTDPALAHSVEGTRVFARVSPAQKSRIIHALRSRGHVVGFLGDGINDVPSLRTADVGISVSSATDIARDAADAILLERGLGVLLTGIVEGRKAFGNVMKYLLMSTSSNFGNVLSMAAASAFLPFLPMLPSQILLNNFLYDLAQITIPTDTVDPELVKKPRRWDIDVIRRFMLWIGPVSSVYDFLTFYVLFSVFHASEKTFHTGWFVESLVTQTLVIYAIRTARSPFANRPSTPLILTTTSIVALSLVLTFTRLGTLLGFTPMPAIFLAFLVVATATYLVIVDWVKRRVLFYREDTANPAKPRERASSPLTTSEIL
ncbi:MAG TPA: magnesium-translocating P-type ATPase [Polyangiaceae bacterium]|nr:magnesium-translocating P-type ATPase [Polyangiaceae bacterium]